MSDRALVVEVRDLAKSYRRAGGGDAVRVLDRVDLAVGPGESIAIQGESGTGKTTLLNLVGALDRPDAGSLRCRGRELPREPTERARWRRAEVGFIFQFHGLLPEFSAVENVALAGLVAGRPRREALSRARQLLDQMGLTHRAEHFPDELSGGEQQRVAVARALFGHPAVVLADEPTGNLDPRTGDRVLDALFGLQRQQRFALLVATHSARLASRCDRVVRLVDGRLYASSVEDGGVLPSP
jgi:lipoprotein-releasing system ATP-binding protein